MDETPKGIWWAHDNCAKTHNGFKSKSIDILLNHIRKDFFSNTFGYESFSIEFFSVENCTIDKTDEFKIHIPRRVQRAFDLDKYQKEKKNV